MGITKIFDSKFKKRYISVVFILLGFCLYLTFSVLVTAKGLNIKSHSLSLILYLINWVGLSLCIYELFKVTKDSKWPWWIIAISIVIFSFLYFIPVNTNDQSYYFYNEINWSWLHSWVIIIFYVISILMLFLLKFYKNSIQWNHLFLIIVVGVAIQFAFKGLNQFLLGSDFGWSMAIWLFLIVIMTDSLAFLFGISFGKHQLAPKISPNKSIEGAVLGWLTATAIATTYACLMTKFGPTDQIILRLQIQSRGYEIYLIYFFLSALLSIGCIIGDLFFSLIKRSFKVKDFSNLIPGHGGLLDRFDASITIAFIMYFLVWIFSNSI